jgi:hypothetical protein
VINVSELANGHKRKRRKEDLKERKKEKGEENLWQGVQQWNRAKSIINVKETGRSIAGLTSAAASSWQ